MNRRPPTEVARPVRAASWMAPARPAMPARVEVGASAAEEADVNQSHSTRTYLFAGLAFLVAAGTLVYASHSAKADFA